MKSRLLVKLSQHPHARMEYCKVLFCLVITATFAGSFVDSYEGHLAFKDMKYAERLTMSSPDEQLANKDEDLKVTVKSMKEKQESINKIVGDLVSSMERNKAKEKAALQAQNMIMETLINKDKRLDSLIKTMQRKTTGEGKAKYAMQLQEKSLQDLTKNYEHLVSVIKEMKKLLPEVDPKNLALHKPAQSSSLRDFWRVDGPVDGSKSRAGWTGSCFSSGDNDDMPWWQVDLEATYIINEVRVTARGDCCASRLRKYTVHVYAEDPESADEKPQVCYQTSDKMPKKGETIARKCNKPLPGRFVRIQGRTRKRGKNELQFCEVEVFGSPETEEQK